MSDDAKVRRFQKAPPVPGCDTCSLSTTRDAQHQRRLADADEQLDRWGRWKCGVRFGAASSLANAAEDRRHDGYQVQMPYIEADQQRTDDAVASLGAVTYRIAEYLWKEQHSHRFIAKLERISLQTVARRRDEILRTVAYWKSVVRPPDEKSFGT